MEKIKCILCGALIRDNFKFIEDNRKRCPACNSEIIENKENKFFDEAELNYIEYEDDIDNIL